MKVEVWSDVVCPWCYIGKRRFESALARFPHRDEVEVRWRSFELDPTAPRSLAGDLGEHLAAKYGVPLAQARAMQEHMTQTAAGEGLDFRFASARSGNTFDAHRLLHLAADRGRQGAVKERLMRAYYTEGEPIGDPAALVRLAAEAGLDAEEARQVLEGDTYADDVRSDESLAAALGITGVPFFVVDGKYGVSGAQPATTLLQVLQTAWAEARPVVMVGTSSRPTREPAGEACADGSCAV